MTNPELNNQKVDPDYWAAYTRLKNICTTQEDFNIRMDLMRLKMFENPNKEKARKESELIESQSE
jgi:hypothetical protein